MIFLEENEYKNKFGIYGITNKINGKTYVGQTGENFQRRYWHHQWKLRNNCHDNSHLQAAWNKYGEDNFEYFVIEVLDDKSKLNDLEITYIANYKSIGKSYNMALGGVGKRGVPMSEKSKQIVGQKNREHMLGSKLSQETKNKMSRTRTGLIVNRKTDRLNKDSVKTIKQMLINGFSATEVSKHLDIDYSLIKNMISNNTWKNIFVDGWDEFRHNRKTYQRLSKKDHKEIYRLYHDEGYTEKELSEKYNRTIDMIKIILKKSYDDPVPSLDKEKGQTTIP